MIGTQPTGLIPGVVMSAVYMLRAFRSIFKGEPSAVSSAAAEKGDLCGLKRVPAVLLIAVLLLTGFLPGLLLRSISPVAQALAAPTPAVNSTVTR